MSISYNFSVKDLVSSTNASLDKCAVGGHYEFQVQVDQDLLSAVVEILRASMDVSRTQYMWMEIVNLVSYIFILFAFGYLADSQSRRAEKNEVLLFKFIHAKMHHTLHGSDKWRGTIYIFLLTHSLIVLGRGHLSNQNLKSFYDPNLTNFSTPVLSFRTTVK